MLVWITGNAGVGKSTACDRLRARGCRAIDADWDGFNHWVRRSTGEVIWQPPYPVPPGWAASHAWRIDADKVRLLAGSAQDELVFLAGCVENEVDVWPHFDRAVCLVADDDTLRSRLAVRTTNAYGKNPDELTIVLERNRGLEASYRNVGASIVDGTLALDVVVDQVLVIAGALT